jgi:hypothetical protein
LAAPEFAPRIINLHRKVVEHLRREVWRTFDPIPSQAMEIGGLLLGTAARETGVIEIEDFEPLAWNGRPERFVFSESERRGLQTTLATTAQQQAQRIAVDTAGLWVAGLLFPEPDPTSRRLMRAISRAMDELTRH